MMVRNELLMNEIKRGAEDANSGKLRECKSKIRAGVKEWTPKTQRVR